MHAAAREGYLEIYKFIAERVDIKNPATVDGETPLTMAIESDRGEIIRLIHAYNKRQRNQTLPNTEKKRRKKK